jgi:DNA processing protein
MAHKAALKAGGKTIAVLGSGLLRPYPASNIRLFDEIVAQGGSVISAFNLCMEPLPGNFPARNRIIAGLADGCLVVQAAAKSGAAITAQFALEQGKEVFAIPGPITDPLSAGCHQLIGQGAKLIQCVEDIACELAINVSTHGTEQIIDTQLSLDCSEPQTVADRILLACRNPQDFDSLLQRLNIDNLQLQQELLELELVGKVTQNHAGFWQVVS